LTVIDAIREIKKGYLPKDTYNIDETSLYWKKLPNSGLTRFSAGKKLDKTRITANIYCNEDSSNKLPLWFIGTA
jgi:hypothetical protein